MGGLHMSRLIYSVEDDQNISFVINKTLTNSGFKVKSFFDGESFFKGLEDELPDLALVDIMLPNGMSGLDIIKKMKANSKYDDVVIIILSAKGDEMDKVTGLDLGADDYISKPFSVLELVSRIKANLRKRPKKKDILSLANITLNFLEHTCMKDGKLVDLTLKEFDLLKYFMENPNKALSRDELLNNVWGYDYIVETRTVDRHVKTLREKLGDSKDKALIESIRSIGYKFSVK